MHVFYGAMQEVIRHLPRLICLQGTLLHPHPPSMVLPDPATLVDFSSLMHLNKKALEWVAKQSNSISSLSLPPTPFFLLEVVWVGLKREGKAVAAVTVTK